MAETQGVRSAGGVLIRELELFNNTAVYFERDVNAEVMAELGQAVETWCDAKDWTSEHFGNGKMGSDEAWCSPTRWKSGDEDGYVAWFNFGYPSDQSGGSYFLANLCGVGEDRLGFSFHLDHSSLGGKSFWNGFIRGPGASPVLEQLSKQGFSHLGKGVFSLPVVLSVEILARGWEVEDYSEAARPLISALEQLEIATPLFQSLLDAAKLPVG